MAAETQVGLYLGLAPDTGSYTVPVAHDRKSVLSIPHSKNRFGNIPFIRTKTTNP